MCQKSIPTILLVMLLFGAGPWHQFSLAQETSAQETSAPAAEEEGGGQDPIGIDPDYEPMTADDPNIALENLQILVKPLTKPELEREAEAWFKLLHEKAKQIAAVRLGVKKTNEALAATDSSETAEVIEELKEVPAIKAVTKTPTPAAESSQQEQPDAGVESPDSAAQEPDTQGDSTAAADNAGTASDMLATASAKKQELLDNITRLQTQRTALADRLEVVLTSLQSKGGEVEEYRNYILAVSGIELDTQDVSAAWTTISGWLTSKEGGLRWAWNIINFLIILAITYIVAKFTAKITNWLLERKVTLSKLAEDLISRTTRNVIMVIGLAVALTALEIDITPIIAAIGAAGFIIAFALQGTLSNFASGLMILINRPFDVGNVVTAGGVTGTIHQMSLVSTTFRTFDNQTIHVPNNEIWGNVITNITANDTRRVDLEFGIGYDDDFEKAERIIRDIVAEHPLVLRDPEAEVVMHALADSSVNIICRPWALTGDWWKVKTSVVRQVKQRFDEAGITIPFPQRDIHVYNQPVGEDSQPPGNASSK